MLVYFTAEVFGKALTPLLAPAFLAGAVPFLAGTNTFLPSWSVTQTPPFSLAVRWWPRLASWSLNWASTSGLRWPGSVSVAPTNGSNGLSEPGCTPSKAKAEDPPATNNPAAVNTVYNFFMIFSSFL